MFQKSALQIEYTVDGVQKQATGTNADLTVTVQNKDGVFDVYVETKKPTTFSLFSAAIPYRYGKNDAFFANGYQSWTDSREVKRYDKMRDLGFVGKTVKALGHIFVNAGDYQFARYKRAGALCRGKGFFHGISYGYIRAGESLKLVGSLNERTGYTVLYADMKKNTLSLEKDLAGVTVNGKYHVFSVFTAEGAYDTVFDAYFAKMNVTLRTPEKMKGYTSWYNYYPNISEDIMLRDLEALAVSAPEINVFQIDDGYQTAVGDWLSIDAKKFPNGMKPIADAIHAKGWKAGLWLAPLSAQHNSKIIAEHPEWMIQENGKPKMIGPNWGNFAGLNFYLPEVRAHIKNFFHVVLNEWGFDMVKLDFLYAASAVPMGGKSRAENMYDAVEFIRECVGDKLMLGCGVPIVPCFNQFDYMRIGADMGLSWSQGIYGMTTHREDVNTRNAIHNALFRRHLNGRAFWDDPDVFLLRDYNIGLSWAHRTLLAKIIKMTGGVHFISDDTSRYNAEQTEFLKYMFEDTGIRIKSVDLDHNIYTVKYEEYGKDETLKFSLKNGKVLSN